MKLKVGNKLGFFLVFVYCFAIVLYSPAAQTADFSFVKNKNQEDRISAISVQYFFHLSDFDTYAISDEVFSTNFEETSPSFSSFQVVHENLLNANFTSYSTQAVNLLIQQRKSDITYPFHCFW
ncbi:MAG: hypothetical protein ACTHY4_03775 [Flavobacteriaceae bacterium]|nr:hypothetical protein [Psychroflexus sp.]